MIQSFSEETMNQLLAEINKYKIDRRPMDKSLLEVIEKSVSSYGIPRSFDGNVESYLEALLGWPRHNLFTYGTLMPGEVNHQILDSSFGAWQKGHSKGHLFKIGWGMDYGLPAMKWDPQGQIIPGRLFVSKQLDWQMLDDFEGPQYQRIWVLVFGKDKILAVANAYQGV